MMTRESSDKGIRDAGVTSRSRKDTIDVVCCTTVAQAEAALKLDNNIRKREARTWAYLLPVVG